MRLLFDQNISRRVVRAVQDCFPGSHHLTYFQLERASDEEIWHFAGKNGYCVVSIDDDFHQRSLLLGHPPKVVWIQLGNADNATLEAFLRGHSPAVRQFIENEEAALLVLKQESWAIP